MCFYFGRFDFRCSNSITPQGDGNSPVTAEAPAILLGSNSITPQGDGNIDPSINQVLVCEFKFHYPARGRKQSLFNQIAQTQRFKFHYPARGRKHYATISLNTFRPFKFHYPARGRKPGGITVTGGVLLPVQIPLPRKGTETEEKSRVGTMILNR